MTTKLADAIERSSSHNEIVTVFVEDIPAAFRALVGRIDTKYGYVDTHGPDGEPLREVWDAEDQSGSGNMDWRVHLIQQRD